MPSIKLDEILALDKMDVCVVPYKDIFNKIIIYLVLNFINGQLKIFKPCKYLTFL